VYLRIDVGLKDRIQVYADRRHTTLTDLVTRFFVRLLEEDSKSQGPTDAEQI
jgi:hypothetical protein